MGGGRPSATTFENACVHNDLATGIVSSLFFLDDLEKEKVENVIKSTAFYEKHTGRVE